PLPMLRPVLGRLKHFALGNGTGMKFMDTAESLAAASLKLTTILEALKPANLRRLELSFVDGLCDTMIQEFFNTKNGGELAANLTHLKLHPDGGLLPSTLKMIVEKCPMRESLSIYPSQQVSVMN